jgi:hypothetical protein
VSGRLLSRFFLTGPSREWEMGEAELLGFRNRTRSTARMHLVSFASTGIGSATLELLKQRLQLPHLL